MNKSTPDTLTQRLDRLERENRHLKRIGSMVILGLAALVLMGQALPRPTPKTIEAEEFVLRDPKGKIRAMLSVLSEGSPLLTFLHEDRLSVMFGVKADGSPALALFDQNGTERVGLGIHGVGASLRLGSEADRSTTVLLAQRENGDSVLALAGKEGESMVSLYSAADGSSGLGLFKKDGKRARVRLGVSLDGSAALTLDDKAGKERVDLGTTANGVSRIGLLDGASRVRAGLALIGDTESLGLFDQTKKPRVLIYGDPWPSLTLLDDQGKSRAVVGRTRLETTQTGVIEERPESSLILFDKDAKVIWRAP